MNKISKIYNIKEQITTLADNAIIYGIGSILTRFISLLLLPLFTTYLSTFEYGVIAFLVLLPMIVQPIFSLGLSASMGICYFDVDDENHKSKTVWSAFFILLISSSVLIILTLCFSEPISQLLIHSSNYSDFVLLTIFGCAINIISTPFTLRIQFEKRAKLFVLITLIGSISSIMLSVYLIVFLRWGIKGIVISTLTGQLITGFLFIVIGIKETVFNSDRKILKELLNNGIPFIPSFAFLFILLQSNRHILHYYGGIDQVGIYSIGFSIGMVISIGVGAFTQAWYPFFMSFKNKQSEASIVFGQIARLYIILVGSLVLCFFIFSFPLTSILVQSEFRESYKIIGLSALAQFFIGLNSLFVPNLFFNKEIKYISLLQGLAAIISIPVNIIFISKWGLVGAGLGLTFSVALLPIFQLFWNNYRKSIYVSIDYKWHELSLMLIAGSIIIPLSIVISNFELLPAAIIAILTVLLLFVVIYKYITKLNLDFNSG